HSPLQLIYGGHSHTQIPTEVGYEVRQTTGFKHLVDDPLTLNVNRCGQGGHTQRPQYRMPRRWRLPRRQSLRLDTLRHVDAQGPQDHRVGSQSAQGQEGHGCQEDLLDEMRQLLGYLSPKERVGSELPSGQLAAGEGFP